MVQLKLNRLFYYTFKFILHRREYIFLIQKEVLLHSFSSNFQEVLLHRKQYNAVDVIKVKQMRVTYGRTEMQILKETALLE